MERTLSIIKPDALAKNVTGKINAIIEDTGLKIIAQKMIYLTETQARRFYAEHEGKDFYDRLVKSIIAGPIVVQVLEGENAIKEYRKVMGATNPEIAEEGTIRNLFGTKLPFNAAHGSDSVESAEREINLFFADLEIF